MINAFYSTIGALFLLLNKFRYWIKGYTSPRPFSMSEYKRAIEYDIQVVNHWISHLGQYTRSIPFSVKGLSVLELGPGADLGVGLYLLYQGAEKYIAIDVNNLVESVPSAFYEEFFSILEQQQTNMAGAVSIQNLRNQLTLTTNRQNDKLNYVWNKSFDFSCFQPDSIDLIVSQAAFEHFDSVEDTIKAVSSLVKSGGLLVAEVDLKTHTRWIRDKDPLNIYRFGNGFYKLASFRGIPNRIRPKEYERLLKKYGWKNVQITPLVCLSDTEVDCVKGSLNEKFRNDESQMAVLSMVVIATKE